MEPSSHRDFYAPNAPKIRTPTCSACSLLRRLGADVLGRGAPVASPLGPKPLVYADFTATGRALHSVEKFLQTQVLPTYGNVHTGTSLAGQQSTSFRHEARQIVAEGVNASVSGKARQDVVLFAGTGATGALDKLVAILGLREAVPEELRPVVFVSAYEHHSNLLPWRESGADVVTIGGPLGVDLAELHGQLEAYAARPLKIGAFAAASNVTGLMTPVHAVAAVMHLHGGLAVFDYATAAPYVRMDMNPVVLPPRDAEVLRSLGAIGVRLEGDAAARAAYLDAVAWSGHKFLGGPNTPGVLVVKRALLANEVPSVPGGGTVFYVTEHHQRYLSNKEEREEGGTPDILGAVRLGLAMKLKRDVGEDLMARVEHRHALVLQAGLGTHPNIELLGVPPEEIAAAQAGLQHLAGYRADPLSPGRPSTAAPRLPIVSFLVRCRDRFLHYGFVCALLNDLFGVQARGGCVCAGPYSQLLLGLGAGENRAIEAALLAKQELLRPGFTRISCPYFLLPDEVLYLVKAVRFIASEGYRFLPVYQFNHKTGEWKHRSRIRSFPNRKWLSHFQLLSDEAPIEPRHELRIEHDVEGKAEATADGGGSRNGDSEGADAWGSGARRSGGERLSDVAYAAALARELDVVAQSAEDVAKATAPLSPAEGIVDEALRWFVWPHEVAAMPVDPPSTSAWTRLLVGDADLGPALLGAGAATFGGAAKDLLDVQRQPSETASSAAPAPDIDSSRSAPMTSAAPMLPLVGPIRPPGPERATPASHPGPDGVAGVAGGVGRGAERADIDKKYPVRQRHDAAARAPFLIPTTLQKMTERTAGLKCLLPRAGTLEVKEGVTTEAAASADADGADADGGGDDADAADAGAAGALPSKKRPLHAKPPKKLLRFVGQALRDWNMIEDGDRLCLGLSGGKDSLALLHVLLDLQKRAPVAFTLSCATVDPQTPSFDPRPLIPYVESLGVPYHYLGDAIVERAKTCMQGDSLCAFCSRMKRGMLYSCCERHGYNKLILAQHLDDLGESFLMSALYNGQLRTMKANYEVPDRGGLRVIRPLVYCRESWTRDFVHRAGIRIISENCPACFEEPKERDRTKRMLKQIESLFPDTFGNLKAAMLPLLDEDMYAQVSEIQEKVLARQRRVRPSPRGLAAAAAANRKGEAAEPGLEKKPRVEGEG